MNEQYLRITSSANLDCMDRADLQALIVEVNEVISELRLLRDYADCKQSAMRNRLCGNIQEATAYERLCDAQYSKMAAWEKW